jgi:hypothetical protein
MISVLARDMVNEYNNVSVKVSHLANKNNDLLKTLATIKRKLENLYKTRETLDNEIIDCINLCREQVPNTIDWKIEPPLSYKE